MSNLNQDIQASHKILDLLERANAQSEAIIDGLPGVFLILNEHRGRPDTRNRSRRPAAHRVFPAIQTGSSEHLPATPAAVNG